MIQQDKELLLKDLCARLPYRVKIAMPGLWDSKITIEPLEEIFKGDDGVFRVNGNGHCIEYIKPYLFPLSSMTEEQLRDLGTYYAKDSKIIIDNAIKSLESPLVMYKAAHVCFNTLEWYNKNHFDYRGLIEKGLANDATGLNIY